MGRKKKKQLIRKLHKWPSLVIAIFIFLWAISGIILNHRYTFSSYDVNRDYLPAEHQYQNWNNAAIRGSVRIDSNNVLFFGNSGVWNYNEHDGSWKDKRAGFPPGADHHKVNCLYSTGNKELYAGTRFGLYHYDGKSSSWQAIQIPHHDNHVVDLLELQDSLWVMTRSHLWKIPLNGKLSFTYTHIPAPIGYDEKVGLFKTLWVIHSGEIYGQAGKLLVDFVAAIFIFLTISGLVFFFFPRMIRKRKKKSKKTRRLLIWNRWSIKWHNKIGIWLVAILIITPFTGMFLRPPLLIPIASSRVGKIPYSILDDNNPWYDQLRRMLFDVNNNQILIATSEGIFSADVDLNSPPEIIIPQPPASVMGYNVFSRYINGDILVGSFSGIFSWDLESGRINDFMTGLPHTIMTGPAIPLSANMISGYYLDSEGRDYLFDYNRGVISHNHSHSFPGMPEFIRNTRMPLWNFALELHTARLFKPMIGDFYILFIPLFGLSTLLILISGIILWIRKYRRKHRRTAERKVNNASPHE